jgi:hypothetical protein
MFTIVALQEANSLNIIITEFLVFLYPITLVFVVLIRLNTEK